MVRFKCDVHAWMAAYAGVMAHPYFAVSDREGRYEIKDVPAGAYTIAVWHPKLKGQPKPVTVESGKPAVVDFALGK